MTPRTPARTALNDDRRELVERWAALWGAPDLVHTLQVVWNGRLTRSLGRCLPSRAQIWLNPQLAEGHEELLVEVLCHEVAHAAVFALHRRRVSPHGKEWKHLMRLAGYTPRATYRPGDCGLPVLPVRRPGHRFLHRCPTCGVSRTAATGAQRWRCAACVRKGRDGGLEVLPLDPRGKP